MDMEYKWRDGAHIPSGLDVYDAIKDIKSRGDDWSPDSLLEASKHKDHYLHKTLWIDKTESEWANEARRDTCRKLISSIYEYKTIGGNKIVFPCAGHLQKTKTWVSMARIMDDDELIMEYAEAVDKYLSDAVNKFKMLRIVLENRNSKSDRDVERELVTA